MTMGWEDVQRVGMFVANINPRPRSTRFELNTTFHGEMSREDAVSSRYAITATVFLFNLTDIGRLSYLDDVCPKSYKRSGRTCTIFFTDAVRTVPDLSITTSITSIPFNSSNASLLSALQLRQLCNWQLPSSPSLSCRQSVTIARTLYSACPLLTTFPSMLRFGRR